MTVLALLLWVAVFDLLLVLGLILALEVIW